jgi:hypothetical protein
MRFRLNNDGIRESVSIISQDLILQLIVLSKRIVTNLSLITRILLLLLLLLRVQLALSIITDDVVEDVLAEDTVDASIDDVSNDTNGDGWIYFAHMTNHYLCLVKSSSSQSRHEMRYPIIADSGANYHMFKKRDFFEDL